MEGLITMGYIAGTIAVLQMAYSLRLRCRAVNMQDRCRYENRVIAWATVLFFSAITLICLA
ncbi:hypothetical protein [Flavobacterium rhizosphaerae]|uniref:Uncharacterized protein n=1 Tax=Flavobacterium rhizosphaerae TaxID=3163298 RepID=A0ABW8YXN5_9FLAO